MSIDSMDLDRIAEHHLDETNYMDLSEIIDRVCDPTYGQQANVMLLPSLQHDDRIKELLSMSVRLENGDDKDPEEVPEEPNVERRLLLKQDLIGEVNDGDVSMNHSLLNRSTRPRKRKSFFFESIDVPPPELQDDFHNEIDMFECSLLLKDRIVVPVSEDCNQTIVYDLDF